MDTLQEILRKHCQAGNLQAVSSVIEQGAHVNSSDNNGTTPLQIAAANGRLDIINLLLKHGANVNKCNKFGWTPLMHATRNGQLPVCERLIESGADCSCKTILGCSLLSLAAASGNEAVITSVLKALRRGLDEYALQESVLSPVSVAALFGCSEVVSLLLNEGYSVNDAHVPSGITALMLSAAGGHYSPARVLLDNGADPEIINSLENTALDVAYIMNHEHLCKILQSKMSQTKSCDVCKVNYGISEHYGWSISSVAEKKYDFEGNLSETIEVNKCFHSQNKLLKLQKNVLPLGMPVYDYHLLHTIPHSEMQQNISKENHKPCNNVESEHCTSSVIPVPPLSPYSDVFKFSLPLNTPQYHCPSTCNQGQYSEYKISSPGSNKLFQQNSKVVENNSNIPSNNRSRKHISCSYFKLWCRKLVKKGMYTLAKKSLQDLKVDTMSHQASQKHNYESSNDGYSVSLYKFLANMELENYVPLLLKHEVDMEVFLALTNLDLEEIGIQTTEEQEKFQNIILTLKKTN